MVTLDPQATTIDFSEPVQAARGTVSSDEDGERQATVLFEQGTTATAVMPDGSTQPLPSLTVRATEYTVGPNGPKAMPAELPPTSGYTYAVELSVDEALAMNASEVRFNRPVPFYAENFLGFDVGMKLPVGSYDRDRATWVPVPDGRVIKVLSTSGGIASVDVTGSGSPASPAALAALGVTNAELQQLATLYPAGRTLWRAALPHFSTVDINLTPEPEGPGPEEPPPENDDEAPDDECDQSGSSVIGCESQSLGERIPVVGTPHQLVYQSRRAPGRDAARTLTIPLSGGTVSSALKRIELVVDVGGKRTTQTFPATANQSTTFTWDGKDAYGRPVTGATSATVKVGYVYDAVYQVPAGMAASFGSPSGISTTVPARQEMTLNQTSMTSIGVIGSPSLGVGGWSVAAHHVYDPKSQVLYLGNGSQMSADVVSTSTEVLAGTGDFGSSGDGGPARSATIGSPRGVLAGPDGSTYIVDRQNQRIRRVSPTGIMSRYAGGGTTQASTTPTPATQARIFSPVAVALDAPGNLYIADQSSRQIYKVTPGGQLTVFAGTGEFGSGGGGDGGPATAAKFVEPFAIAVGPDGSVYIADVLDRRIRRVGPDGIISTFAGTGSSAVNGNGGPARQAGLGDVLGLSFGLDGSLYISNYRDANFVFEGVRRVGPDGIIRPVIGGGNLQPTDGIQATQASFSVPIGVWATADGTIYFAEQVTARVWRVTPDGVLSRAAGGGSGCFFSSDPDFSCGEGAPATQASLLTPVGASIDPAGRLLVAEHDGRIVRRFRSTLPSFTGNGMLVAAGDPGELYEFDQAGRHLRTINGFTGATRFSFAYNSSGLLTGITDGDGGTTTIERATNGNPTAIVGPDDHRTTLAVEPGGFLQRIEDPAGHAWVASYGSGGLVTSITDPNTKASEYTYGGLGRLTKTLDAAGGTKTPARTDQSSGYSVAMTSGLGVSRSYDYEPLPGGGSRRVATNGAGLTTTTTFASDGSATTTTPDGATVTTQRGPDPRLGMQASVNRTSSIQLPSGLTATMTGGRRTELSNPSDPLSIVTQTDSTILNGRLFRTTWTTAARTFVDRSPAGRTLTRKVDSEGRTVQSSVAGLTPVTFEYDNRGRLVRTVQGSRTSRLSYDASGRIATHTDPLGRESQYFYDSSDRLVREVLPGGRTALISYDARGNVSSFTPPGRPAHQVAFNSVNLPTSYSPPDFGGANPASANFYDVDRRVTRVLRPGGTEIGIGYDGAGRTSSITTPSGETRASYSASTGRLTGLSAPGGVALAFNYDGMLPEQVTWSGLVSGTVAVSHNNDAQVATQSVNGGNEVSFGYDDDGFLTLAGDLSLSRDPANGLLTGTTLGSITTARQYDGFGELAQLEAKASAASIFHNGYTRDDAGRILRAVETVGGSTLNVEYAYDEAGRLKEVRRNGTVTAVYAYDASGNRTSLTGPGISLAATYDNQDRLLTYGEATFTYTAVGELQTRTDASGTATYAYDAFGNLTSVTLQNGTQIQYVLDGQHRRVGRRVNGVLERGWLYGGPLAPVAELNGSGQLVSRFVYGTSNNVPEYIIRSGQTYRIITDQLGSVRLVVRAADGNVVQRIDYDEWGRITQNTNPGFQPFGYAGGLYDDQTELVHFGAREYDPKIGRWTSQDEVRFVTGVFNLYQYGHGDPVNFVDATGRTPVHLVLAGLGFAFGAGSNLLAQLILNGGDLSCVDASDVLTAGFGGALGGLLAPQIATLQGAALLGGVLGAGQSVVSDLANGENPDLSRAGWSGALGAAGGAIAGAFLNPAGQFTTDGLDAAVRAQREAYNNALKIEANTSGQSLLRGAGGALLGSTPTGPVPCPCE
jgi:RHS repeat-associated protein